MKLVSIKIETYQYRDFLVTWHPKKKLVPTPAGKSLKNFSKQIKIYSVKYSAQRKPSTILFTVTDDDDDDDDDCDGPRPTIARSVADLDGSGIGPVM